MYLFPWIQDVKSTAAYAIQLRDCTFCNFVNVLDDRHLYVNADMQAAYHKSQYLMSVFLGQSKIVHSSSEAVKYRL